MSYREQCALVARVERRRFRSFSALTPRHPLRLRRLLPRLLFLGIASCVTLASALGQTCPATMFPATGNGETMATFTSTGGISVTGNGSTTNYSSSSTITPSGIPAGATVTRVALALNCLNGSGGYGLNDFVFLLAGPGSSPPALDFLDDACATASNVTFTFDGTASGQPANEGSTGTTCSYTSGAAAAYLPFNEYSDVPFPGYSGTVTQSPPLSTGSFGIFAGLSGSAADSAWTLYVADENPGDSGATASINNWTLAIYYSESEASTTTVLSSSAQDVFTSGANSSITLTATVTSSGGTPEGSVTFADGSTTLSGCGAQLLSDEAATCTTTLTTEGIHSLTATYNGETGFAGSNNDIDPVKVTAYNHTTQSGNQYCNDGTVTATGDNGIVTTPLPSYVFIGSPDTTTAPTGGGVIDTVTLELKSLSTGSEAGEEQQNFLLVGPTGGTLLFAANGGTETVSQSVSDLIFEDSGSTLPYDTALASNSTYTPFSYFNEEGEAETGTAAFPTGTPSFTASNEAAPTGAATFSNVYTGSSASGAWHLYYGSTGNGSSTVGGWCLDFTMTGGAGTTTSVTSSAPTQVTSTGFNVTATVTDTGNPGTQVNAGAVAFSAVSSAGTVSLGTVNVSGGSAQLSVPANTLAESTYDIVASFSDTTNTYGPSHGQIAQRINNPPPTATTSSNTYTYCSTTPILVPYNAPASLTAGTAAPYPSNITVANLPGTVDSIAVELNYASGFQDIDDIAALLTSPSGANLDFFSNVGGFGTASSAVYYVVSDDATNSAIGQTSSSYIAPAGSYPPESYGLTGNGASDTFPACQQLISDCQTDSVGPPAPTSGYNYAPNQGSSTFSSVLGTGFSGNGTWSLYLETDVADFGGLLGSTSPATPSWCMQFTENPPTVAVNTSHSGTGGGGDFVQSEQNAQITVSITNDGPGSTSDPTGSDPLTVTDTLNSALTFVSGSGSGWSCSASGQIVTCINDNSIADGSAYPELTIDVDVSSAAPASITNSATVSGAGVVSTSSGTDTITITTAPVLSLTKSHTGNFTQGATAVWNIEVSNTAANGSTGTNTINVADTLPGGYTLASYTSTGNAWTCAGSGTSVACSSTAGIAAGSSSTITLTVNVPAASPTSVSNTASAWGGGDTVHTSAGTAASSNTDTVTVMQVPATISINGNQTQSANTGTAFGSLAVTVDDANSVVIPNYSSVTFTAVPVGGASGTFSNGTGTITIPTNSSGVADPGVFTANTTAGGPYQVTVTAGSASTSFSLTNTAPALVATSVVVSGYPSPDYVGVAHTATLIVDDQNGNPLTTYSGSATITSSDSAATITSPVTITNGTATFSVTFNTPASSQSITATIPGPISGSQTGIVVDAIPGLVVTTANDDSTGDPSNCPSSDDCSLRDALAAAAADGEGNITFDSTVFTSPTTITLTGPLTIPANTSIQGLTSGSVYTLANLITLNGNGKGEVFNVDSGVNGTSIANLIVENGSDSDANIFNAGTLAVSASTVTTGDSYPTRGFYNTGTLTLTGTTVSGNLTGPAGDGYGAGIYNTGTLKIVYSTISGNENTPSAYAYGGGIYTTGSVEIESSTIANNFATGAAGEGGGIYIASGSVTINNSIVAGNTGGDIYGSYSGSGNQSATLTALGNYGGPTQTMLPEPGSAAICGGVATNIPAGFTTDQRGEPNTNTSYTGYSSTPCVDAGAVQTNYAMSFTTPPPSTGTVPGTAMLPAPQVTLTESGAVFTAASTSISATDANSDLTTTPATASTVSGVATYNSLIFTSTTSDDTLIATLPLNPGLTTPLSLATQSTSFSVAATMPPSISKAFGATSIALNGSTSLSFSIQNPNASASLTVVGFTDTFPSGLIVSTPNALTGSCGSGTITATAGAGAVSLSGATLAAGASCNFSVSVTGVEAGQLTNTTSVVTSTNGGTGNTASANITVVATPTFAYSPSPNSQIYGTAIAIGSLDATATYDNSPVSGTFVYTTLVNGVQTTLTAGATILPVGSYTITATFSPSSPGYSGGFTTTGYTVSPATFAVNWTATNGTVTVTPAGGGPALASGAVVAAGSSYNLVATPNAGYYFTGWTGYNASDVASPSSAATTLTVNGNENLVAGFSTIPGYVVTTIADDATGNTADCPAGNVPASNNCTLRDAITAANTTGAGNITFNAGLNGTITLTSTLPALTANINITGPGANVLSISGGNSATVGTMLTVNSGATATISGLTFTGGDSDDEGGAISSSGNLTLASDVFSNNTAGGTGGAVWTNTTGSLTVTNSTFSSNTAPKGDGGALTVNSGLVVENSTFSANTSGEGGAIGVAGTATIADSTFSGNTASFGSGGAVNVISSQTTITNSIFSGNQALTGAGVQGAATSKFNLFYNNLDNQDGGSGLEDDCLNCTSNTNAISGNPSLATLGNYGGPTPTLLPLPASAAICGGSLTLIPAGVTTDQRGLPNTNSSYTNYTSGTACVDVGAVQTNYALSFTAEPPSAGTVPGTAMSPAPQVTVTESGVILTAGSASLMLEDTSADLTTLPATASTVSGVATFSSLIFTNSTSSDKLLATLPLDPTASPAPAISTLSDPFSVGMLTPTLSFVPNPNSQTYGTAITAGSLDATATYNNSPVSGTFTYTTLVGGVQTTLVAGTTILPVGSYTITASFAPSSSNYGATSTTADYQVTAAGVTLGFVPNPNSQTYGTAITAGSLDATATYNNSPVSGTFTYTTLVGGVQTTLVAGTTILPVGSYTITASFAPSSTNYSSGSTTAGYSVTSPAPTPTISFDPNPDSQSYGTPIESGSLDATAKYDGKKVAGTFAYTTLVSGVQTTLVAGTTILPAGRYTITAAFTPSSSSYSPASATASYTVTADSVTLGFAPNPRTQTYGTPIAAGSLDATATYNGSPVPGTFTYTTLVSGVTTTLTAGTTVLPIGSYIITASFTPSSTNYSNGSITAGYAVTTATSAPVAKISPTSINFGTLYLGSIVTQEVTITNTGNAAMTISNPLIAIVSGGDSSEFITVNLCPRSLAAGRSCVMTVTFIAGPFYNPQTATLTINDNAASSPQTVMLYATVIDPVAQLSAGNLSFGTVKVGKSSASQSVTLSNPGGTALTGISIGVGGADPGDFLATSNCGSSLASKKSCTISVAFEPTAKKSRTASVTISDNAQNSPQSILLSGTGN